MVQRANENTGRGRRWSLLPGRRPNLVARLAEQMPIESARRPLLAPSSLYADAKAAIQTFHQENLDPILTDLYVSYHDLLRRPDHPLIVEERRRLLGGVIGDNPNQVEDSATIQQHVNAGYHFALGVFGLTLFGTTFGSTLALAVAFAGLSILSIPIVVSAAQELVYKRTIGTAVLDGIVSVCLLGLGYLMPQALFFLAYWTSAQLFFSVRDRSVKSMSSIFGDQPRFVWLLSDGVEVQTAIEKVQADDIIVVRAGETVPVDGVVVQGIASIDQHMLTGESQPAEKSAGDRVFAATITLSGSIHVRVEQAGSETVAAQINELLYRTADHRSSLELQSETIARRAAPIFLGISIATLPILGVTSALATLMAYFGYEMRLLAPLSISNYLSVATRHSILIKDGRALEQLSQVDTVVFDKTGTLTQEQPHVAHIHTCAGYTSATVLGAAAAAEYKQTHPIARAILEAARQQEIQPLPIDDATYEIGYGLRVQAGGQLIRVGSARFITNEGIAIPAEAEAVQAQCREQGHSLVYVALDDALAGMLELHATVRPEVQEIVAGLHARGQQLYIISGDQEQPTRRLAQELGIDYYFAEVLPEDKAGLITQLQEQGRTVCFVGDGINDSIALKKAHVSISLRGASTIATDTAQIILMDESLQQMVRLFDLSSDMNANMKVNFALTILPSIFSVFGVYFLHFGVVSTTFTTFSGTLAGIGNSMLPLLRAEGLDEQHHNKLTDAQAQTESLSQPEQPELADARPTTSGANGANGANRANRTNGAEQPEQPELANVR